MRPVLARLVIVAIVSVAVAVSVVRFAAIDANSHSASDTLRPWLIQVAVIAVVAGLAIALIRRWSQQGR